MPIGKILTWSAGAESLDERQQQLKLKRRWPAQWTNMPITSPMRPINGEWPQKQQGTVYSIIFVLVFQCVMMNNNNHNPAAAAEKYGR